MKYYIPIHRDNIDNVTSAECLSPMEYYQENRIGYHYFRALDEVPSYKELLLFKSVPKISVEDEITEDVVVYIEFDDDKQLERFACTSFEEGVRVPGTIELYPWNCRLLFQSVEAVKQTVVMCRMSLNNKSWGYYEFDELTTKPAVYKMQKLKDARHEDVVNRLDAIKINEKRNRLKGFLYSYILGRYLSIPQSLATLLQTEKKMYDLATSLNGLQSYQGENIVRQLNDLEAQFLTLDPNRVELQRQWKIMVESHFKDSESQQSFETIIQELGGDRIMKYNFAKMSGVELRPRYEIGELRHADWKDYKRGLEDYTQNQLMRFRINKGDTNTKEDFVINGLQVNMSPKYGNFYGKLITYIISGSEWLTIDNLRLNRLDVASEITRLVRDAMIECGQDWEASPERSFLNGLRQYIASGGDFDITQAPSVVLKGIATFILKGDDFEEMMRYMEYTALNDYRFALGLWGACKGFVDMPKTATQRTKLDPKGEVRVYAATHQLLTDMPENAEIMHHVYEFRKKEKQPSTADNTFTQAIGAKIRGLTEKQQSAILDVWRENNEKIDDVFFAKVSKIKGVGSVKLKRIKEALKQSRIEEDKEPDLFGLNLNEEQLYFDIKAWRYIEPLLPNDQIIRDKVKDDLKWFVSHSRRNASNKQMLLDYKDHLKQKAHPTNPRAKWTAAYFGELNIDAIMAVLEKLYL